ncbi:histidine--tRNA ligase [Candidatus Micrarchaeota archaeon]|nr:histidine--tRNA ligase [Candidatus Micrarchaeota archaeon]
MDSSPVRGMREFLPAEKALRTQLADAIKKNCLLFGFEQIQTPSIDSWEVLSAKFAGGGETIKEAYSFKDQGKREVGLRYDLTVPLSRFVANNKSLPKPLKLFQTGMVFRDGPIKAGRYREFEQFDADIIGCSTMLADAEVLSLAASALESLGINFGIKVNNRKLLNAVLEESGVPEQKRLSAIICVDKLAKIGEGGVKKELAEKGVDEKVGGKLLKTLSLSLTELEAKIKSDEGRQTIGELKQVFAYVGEFGFGKKIVFDCSLARGLNYYTGTVFEGFASESSISSSVCAGGRYDNMIGALGGENLPAVGISFGIDTLCEVLKEKTVEEKSLVKAFVIGIGVEEKELIKIVKTLREAGVNTGFDLSQKGVSKNLNYASKKKIPYALIVGNQELKSGKLTLRDMKSGKEEKLGLKEIAKKLV